MTKIKLITLCFLLAFLTANACLNGETKLLKSGKYLYMDERDNLPFGHHFFRNELYEALYKLDSLYQKTNDVAYLSDKGLVLILQKKYAEALKIYLDIEKKKPNRYSTASNLGTIYELMGENEKALEWIRKAVSINPKSHYGSEWIHVKILEAKLKGAGYFTGNFLLNVDFGNADAPSSGYTKAQLDQLDKSLYYQLNERISFIKPKDPIIAVLLFEMGNVKLLKKQFSDAHRLFEKANEYGFDTELFKRRFAYAGEHIDQPLKYKPHTAKHQTAALSYPKAIGLIVSIFLGIMVIFLYLKKNRG